MLVEICIVAFFWHIGEVKMVACRERLEAENVS